MSARGTRPVIQPHRAAGVLALALWLACAAAWAQTESEATAPAQVGSGTLSYDPYGPGDHNWQRKWVFSYPGKLKASWRPPASDGGSAVTAYRVYWYQTADYAGTVQSMDVTPSGAGLQVHYVTGLTDGVEYGVGVTAVNAAGEGPFRSGTGAALASLPYTSPRDDFYVNVPQTRHDMQVGSLSAARAAAAGTLRVTWSRPTGSKVLDHYTVSWARDGSATVAGTAQVAKTASSYDITGVTAGQRYRIEVDTLYRLTAGDEGQLKTTEVTVATPYGAPAAPRDLEVLGNDASLAVSWSAPAADGGSPVTGYRLSWSAPGTTAGSQDLGPAVRAHTIANLSNELAYTVTLTASNAYYTGPEASGADTPFLDGVPSFGDATVPAQTRIANLPGAPDLTLPAASGGNLGLSYRLSPAVPGLTFDPETRVLSGMATHPGQHQMTYRADDGDRFTAAADAAVLTFTLTVKLTTPPTAAPITKDAYENLPLTFAESDFTDAFSDPDDGDSLSSVAVCPPPATAGRLTLGTRVIDPCLRFDPDALDTLVFTPAADYTGTATFGFHLWDQPGGVTALTNATITVHPNDPPLAAASSAPFGSVVGGRTGTLTNTSRDPDDDAMTWHWEQIAGATVALSDATAESPTFTAPDSMEQLTFRLTATDEHGASDTATVSLDVYTPPAAPATLTAATSPGTVTLRWTAGAANGAAIESWWYAFSGDGGTTWSDWSGVGAGAHVYRTVVRGLQNGTAYTFAVRARNAAGDGVQRTVTATPGGRSNNYPPVARASWEYVHRYDEFGRPIQTNLHLSAKASTDPDLAGFGNPLDYLTFRWTQVRDDPAVWRHDVRWPTSRFPYLDPEPKYPVDLVYRLTVTDRGWLSDTTYLTVKVRYPAGRPSLGLTRSIALGLQPGETLSKVLPAATGGNGTLTYGITPPAAGVMSFDAAKREVTFTPTAAGTWNFGYNVTDADGDSDTIKVTLRAAAGTAPQFAAGASIQDLRLLTGREVGPAAAARPQPALPRATGGNGDLAYSLKPDVPGLSFDPSTRLIAGTPTTAGSYAMTYRAVDSDADAGDADSATLNFTIEVVENTTPVALFAGQTVDVSVKIPGPEWGENPTDYPYGVDLRGYFYDADGDDLEFVMDWIPSEVRVIKCTNYRYDHCLFTTEEKTQKFTVYAVDPSGAKVSQHFRLTGLPANRAPAITYEDGSGGGTDLRDGHVAGRCGRVIRKRPLIYYFSDPDGDHLTYRAQSASPRARVTLNVGPVGSQWSPYNRQRVPYLTVDVTDGNVTNWTTTVTVTASDPEGLSVSLVIPLTVYNVPEDGNSAPCSLPDPWPTFGDVQLADQSWPATKAIIPLTLPEASDGTPPLAYSLAPPVPGLTFDAATRTLSGTPTTVADATAMTYRVTDSLSEDPTNSRISTLGFNITITGNAVGTNAPTSAAIAVTIAEDTVHTFAANDFAFSDADPDEQLHKLQIETLPAHGTLRLNDVEQAAGAQIARADLSALEYHPPAHWHGLTSFTFKVLDTTERASTQAYDASVVVNPVNDVPTSADFERTVAEDTTLTFVSTDFAFLDADGDDDARSAVVIASLPAAAAGTLKLAGTAVTAGQSILAPAYTLDGLQFAPAANWNGTAAFRFGVVDSSGAASLASNTATIRVTAVNDPPATAAITRSIDEDTTLELTLADFTFDDPDAGDQFKAIVFKQAPQSGDPAQPAGTLSSFHGSVQTVIDGDDTVAVAGLTRLEYRPDTNFAGQVKFTFTVRDQADADSRLASGVVQVDPVNDPPTSQDASVSASEDQTVSLETRFAFNDLDAGDSLKAVQVASLPAAAAGALKVGAVPVLDGQSIPAGSLPDLVFAPAANWHGATQFDFRVVDQADAGSKDTYTLSIVVASVPDAPTAADLKHKWVPGLDFLALFESVFADPDEGDHLKKVKLETTPTGGSLWNGQDRREQGAVLGVTDLQDLVFKPQAGTYRGARVRFRVRDQTDRESAAYTLTMWRNAPPKVDALRHRTREDTPLPFRPDDFEEVFTDPDTGDGLAEVIITSPLAAAHGSLMLDGVAISAGQVIARASLNGLVFTPTANWNGHTTFGFKMRDRFGAESAAATATLAVVDVNDAPVAAVLAVSTPEDTAFSFTAAHFEGVFSDPDSADSEKPDSLQAVRVVTLPDAGHGALALSGIAVTAEQIIAHADLGNVTFTPVANWNGEARFTFKVVDQLDAESAATAAQVTVTAVPDAPVADTLEIGTPEDIVLTFTAADFEGVFSDVDPNDSLKAVKVVSLPDAARGKLALSGQKPDVPVEKPVDGKSPHDRLGLQPNSAVTVDQVIVRGDLGKLTFKPQPNWTGQASFTFQVMDQSDTASATASGTITVTDAAEAPRALALNVSTAEDATLTFTPAHFEGRFNDPDRDDSLKAVRVVSLPDAAHGELALARTAVTAGGKIEHADLGNLTFAPVANWNGAASFTFKVVDQTDLESADAATATVTVTAVADPPAAAALGTTTAEDTALTFAAADFTDVFSDPDSGDSLKAVKVVSLPAEAQGALALNGTGVTVDQVMGKGDLGTLTFTPAANFAAAATFGFQVLDPGDRASATATATITVTAVADPPAATALSTSTAEETALTFAANDFEGVFTDPDAGDSLKAVKVMTLPAATAGALELSGSAVTAEQTIVHADLGNVTFTPGADWNGDASFTFKVVDQSDAESAAATATVTVTAVADPPAAAALGKSTAEDTALTFAAADFTGVFSDPDPGDSLKSVMVTSLPDAEHGALALSGIAVTVDQVILQGDLGTLVFAPVANWNGQASFMFKVVDQTDAESAAAATATITVTAVADAPEATALSKSTAEETALTFAASDFEGVFTDPEGDSLKSVKVVTLPAATAGVLALGGKAVTANQVIVKADLGTLVFTPVANWNGQATFTFKVVDTTDTEAAATATATVTVTAVADAPEATALSESTAEDTALTFAASDFDGVFTDPDSGDSLKSVKVITLPAATAGVLALGGTAVTVDQVIVKGDLGTLVFTPVANWNGDATFTFQVSDRSDRLSGTATATVTVTAVNDAPAASALQVSTAEDTALTFAASDFEGKFSDLDAGDSLKSVKVVTLPAATAGVLALGGTAVSADDVIVKGSLGTLTFTPVANWNGDATFTFKVVDKSDAASAAAATATVTVTAVADAPAASALQVSTAEDTARTFTASDFEGVFTDADGDSLKSVKVVTLPAATEGALALGGTALTAEQVIVKADLGTLTFTPVANYAGDATFTFKVVDTTDAEAAATATATVTVTAEADAPAASALQVSTAEDTARTFTASDFEGVFTDPDGDTLKSVKVVTLPVAAAGALALGGTAVSADDVIVKGSLGTLKFTPVANWNGDATFTFKVVDQSDAEAASAATATVTVTAVADAPAASALSVSTTEETARTFTASDFEGVFTDADGDSLKSVKVVTLPAATAGALALNGTAVSADDVIVKGDLGTLVFTPVANWNGDASFTFKVVDTTDAESAAAATATATVTVTAVNDVPVASALSVSTLEDTALTFAASDFGGVVTDADAGDSLKSVKVVTLPAATAGVLALGGTAVTANQVIAKADLGTLVFTPVANWNGDATFTFKVVDQADAESAAAATATVTVTAVNDAPAASALQVSTLEDTALTFTAAQFEGVFTDADAGDSLKSVKVVTLPAATAGVLALNGTAVTAEQVIVKADLGTLVFTPVANWNGDATFTFKVADPEDAESATATATVSVTTVNDVPTASALKVSTAEDTALTFTAADFDGVFSDVDGDTLKSVKVVTLPAATAGVLALNGTALTANQKIAHGSLGTLKFTPVANWNGDATFTFKVADQSDAESAAAATATVTVTAVADAPAASTLNVSTSEDTALTFTASDFEGVFTDADAGDSLKAVKVVSLPAAATEGALALGGTAVTADDVIAKADLGTLKFTPVTNFTGAATFTFKVVDTSDAESADAATARVTVGSTNDAPAAGPLQASTSEDTALTFTAAHFEGVFTDADTGDSLKAVRVVTLPAATEGALALGGTAVTADDVIAKADLGTLVFTPVANWNGDASFTFKVADQSDAESAAATATVTVSAVNDAPAAGPLRVSTSEDTALTFTAAHFEGVFTDTDTGDSLKAVRVVTLPAATEGALALSGTAVTADDVIAKADLGTLKFTPAANWNGDASFTFKVADQSDAESAAATATVTVSAVNDAPTAGALGKTTAEDTALAFTASDFDGAFSDADTGDSLKTVKVVSLPAATEGALTLGATAVTANQVIARGDLGTLKFTPVANWNGDATFTYKVVDTTDAESAAAATATVTVTAVNDAPAAGPLGKTTAEDTALTFAPSDFSGVFSDPDTGDSLKAVKVVTLPAAAAGALAQNGTAVTANQVIVKADLGSLVFTPVANYAGDATFTFKVTDQSDAESADATATVTVTAEGDAPMHRLEPGQSPSASLVNVSTTEDTPVSFTAAAFEGVFSDPDSGDSLKAVKVVTLPAATAGTLALGGTAVTANQKIVKGDLGTLTFTPVANWNGDATFTFKVVDQSDAESAAAATATVTVTAVNDAPEAGALKVSTEEDTALTFAASDFEGKFSDLDSDDSLKAVKVVTLPVATEGALALGGTAVTANQKIAKGDLGTLKFTPAANWNGDATFTFKVVDQSNAESAAAATVTVTVTKEADAPAASALKVSTDEDTALTFTASDFEGVFTDADGDSLKSVKVVTLPAATGGALALGGTAVTANQVIVKADLGTLKFTPVANWNGDATFTFKVVDSTDAESAAAATATVTVTAKNDAPAASALNVSTDEDTALAFTAANFEGKFSDPDTGDSLKTVKVVTLPAATAGVLALGGTAVTANQVIVKADLGTLKFTPVANWNGDASFTFKVADQSNAESASAATATVTVTAAADAPAARTLNVSTAEETALTFTASDFEGVFTDADGDSLKSVKVVTLPAVTAGALALGGTGVTANQNIVKADLGTLKFTPVANYTGQATFTFKVVDTTNAESAAAATARVTVTAVNDAPAASALKVSTSEDTALTFAASDFEGAFSDPDSDDSLKSVKVTTLPAAAHGALALNGSSVTANQVIAKADLGTLKFTPAADWNGDASFTFKVVDQSDAASAAAATATVTVTAVADAPAATALNVSTAEETALTFAASDFEGVFTDPDGDSLKAVKVVTLPAATAGALALGGKAVTASQKIVKADLGTLKFTPVANYAGKATFTFKVVDTTDAASAAAATATVTVTAVNDAPEASALQVSTAEDTARTFTAANFEGTFSDPDSGDSLKAVKVVTLPATAAGALALNGTAVTANQKIVKADLGTLKFTPVANYAGDATFTFKVVDTADAESASAATATVTVTAVADAPAALTLNVSTAEDTARTFTAANFEGAFSDPDSGDGLKSVKVVTLPAATAGVLALNATAVTANQKIAKGSLGTLKFTPVANWHGQATFTFKVEDTTDAESASAATATVTVTAVNDAPTAGALSKSTAEDTALTFATADFTGKFSDPDTGDSLKAVKVVTLPAATAGALALGTTAVTADQVIAKADLGTLKFTPVANYAGTATFTFKVVDKADAESAAAATVTITVGGANDAPTASTLNVSTAEDTALTFTASDFEGAFSDPDSGDSLKAVKVVTLPAATAGALALGTTAVTADQVIAKADLGTLKFTPVANYAGTATFTFKVTDKSDAESAAAATARVTVTAVADAPVATALGKSTAEDTALTFAASDFTGVFSDADGDSLKAVKVVTLPAAAQGALALDGTGVGANQVIAHADLGTLKFTPAADWNGKATFGFRVSDPSDRLSAEATATVTVTAVADAPAAGELTASTAEDTALTFAASDFDGVFSDADGDTLKAVKVATLPAATAGALALDGTAVTANQSIVSAKLGTLKFTPAADWNGEASFTFKVVDTTNAESDAATVTVTVTAAADPPAAGALGKTTEEDTALTFVPADFSGVFSDPDAGDSLKAVRIVSLPAATEGALALGPDAVAEDAVIPHGDLGGLKFTPAADWNGDATFTFKVVDQTDAESADATATVTVTAVGDAPKQRLESGQSPTAALVSVSTTEDTAVSFTAAAFDAVFSDPDENDSLKAVQVASLPDIGHGVLSLGADAVSAEQKIAHADLGTLTFTPAANWHGDASFTFKLLDQSDAASEAAKATITVTAVNDAPAAAALSLSTVEDTALTFTAAHFEDVFSDADTGDSLKSVKVVTLPAATEGALALGGAAVTAEQEIAHGDLGTLTFTPAAAYKGRVTFTFKVLDQSAEASAAATATITVTDRNDGPIAPGEIPDQWATQGVPFTYTAPADLFTDADDDPLEWSAEVRVSGDAQGSSVVAALPDWVTFGKTTRTFQGTPAATDLGSTTIRVIATDPEEAFAYVEFKLTVLPPVQVSVTGPAQPVAEGTPAAFTVALSRAAPEDVTVRWATADGTGDDAATAGSDYLAQAETDLTISAGQTERIVAVATLDDGATEDAETFAVQLSLAAGGLPAGVELGATSATASIVDAPPPPAKSRVPKNDDRAMVSLVTPAPVQEGDTAVIEIVLSKPVAEALTVHWATADASASAAAGDYEPHAAVLVTFAAGDTRRSAQVATYADDLEEGTETFLLSLSAQELPAGVARGVSQVTVAIEEDRRPVADAGPDQEVAPGAMVTLDGSASHHPGGDPITGYAWTQSGGEPVDLDDIGSAAPRFTAPELPGALTFELVVDAGGVDSLPDAVTVTVRDAKPRFLETVGDLTFVAEREIEPITLPAASGGNGPLTHALSSEPAGLAGLMFDPATRVLSGTPDRHGRLTFTYVAHDADANRELSDAAVLTFVVTVREAPYRRILRPVLAALGRATLYGARSTIGTRFAPEAAADGQSGTLNVSGHQVPLEAAADGAQAAAAADAEWFPPAYRDRDRDDSHVVSLDELLGGSAFTMPLAAAAETAAVETATADGEGGPALRWTLWGQGHRQGFGGEPEAEASIQGDLTTAWLGLEASPAGAPWLAGVAVSRSLHGGADYTVEGGDQEGETGRMDASFTALYPYARFQPAAGTEITALLGAGLGEAVHDRDGAARETGDLTLLLGAIGLRQALSAPAGWLELAVRGDGGVAWLMTGPGGQAMHDLVAVAANARLGLEAAARLPLAGGELRPFVEAAGRYDAGDDVTGAGLEVAGGLRYAVPSFELEARGRLLALHTATAYREHGLSVTARVGPGAGGHGLSLALSPRWGAPTGAAEALWRDELPAADLPAPASTAGALDGSIAYGIALADTGVLTPFAEVGVTDGSHRVRVGTRIGIEPDDGFRSLTVELGAERSETGFGAPDYQFGFEIGVSY